MDLNLWAIELTEMVDLISQLPHRLRTLRESLPVDGTPSERLSRLITLWQGLRAESPNLYTDPSVPTVESLSPVLGDNPEARYIKEDYRKILWQVYQQITKALEEGGEDVRVIPMKLFPTFRRLPSGTDKGTRSAFILVNPSELPPGHYIRSLLPKEELFEEVFLALGGPRSLGPTFRSSPDGEPYLMPDHEAQPHSWYFTAPALSLTRRLEARRKQEKAEQDRLEEVNREIRKRAWEESAEGLQARVHELEKKLKDKPAS